MKLRKRLGRNGGPCAATEEGTSFPLRSRAMGRLLCCRREGGLLYFPPGRDGCAGWCMQVAMLRRQFGVKRQRLTYDLVHVVVAVGGKPPDEMDAMGLVGQLLVLSEQLGILRS